MKKRYWTRTRHAAPCDGCGSSKSVRVLPIGRSVVRACIDCISFGTVEGLLLWKARHG